MATVLKVLLAERHLKSHPDFLAAYDRCAAQLDPPIPPGHGPAKAQYYQWLSGRMVGLPRDYHCRVLEKMFPGWTVEGLFRIAGSSPAPGRSRPAGAADVDAVLEAFFGAEMVTGEALLVHPSFESIEPLDDRRTPGFARRSLFGRKEGAHAPGQSPETLVVLESDLRGLLYVFDLLQRHTRIPVRIRSDRDIAAPYDRPFISFGLGGNDYIRRYAEIAERPLFTVDDGATNGSFYPRRVELSDGRRFDAHDVVDVGIIARVRPNPDLHPGRYWVYCGGLGRRGTAGAGRYLADNWRPLQRSVGDHDFVAVVGLHKYSDEANGMEHLLIDSAG
ncbi:hypothetical protein AB0H42_27785 [Nocardia sp. NPDC050799]|uniref:hypothetical protein n=1 Tax=Nocardia sp. NPDC050799 TaxID=3154842 RepID=UPI00340BB7B5